mmetsp:Transcript_10969/g.30311  ORF Transcript_10969/g.30311 Transcript_10969/m.30311 type:complete len:157 (-) Transcript_10969:914-1384(-)
MGAEQRKMHFTWTERMHGGVVFSAFLFWKFGLSLAQQTVLLCSSMMLLHSIRIRANRGKMEDAMFVGDRKEKGRRTFHEKHKERMTEKWYTALAHSSVATARACTYVLVQCSSPTKCGRDGVANTRSIAFPEAPRVSTERRNHTCTQLMVSKVNSE